jgi:hypothetical protein
MQTKQRILLGAALMALLSAPAAVGAVEVYKTDKAKVDLGLRMQLMGTLEYSGNPAYVQAVPVSTTTGNGNRDYTRIFLFQKQNRLRVDADLEGTLVKFENAMGGEAYAGGNNLYDLTELSAEVPLGASASVVAGLGKMPWNQASATYDQNSLFTDKSQLFNLFFNAGYDTAVYGKARFGLVDAVLGVEQGAGNLPQRYIPERLILPVPVFLRLGLGNLKEDPARFRQMGFGAIEETQWALHANGFWAADSGAGHGTLFSQMGSQAELSKGPFQNGNFMFVKGYNPFAGYTTGSGGLAAPDNQFWNASIDGQLRVPTKGGAVVAGAQWNVAQYVAKGMNSTFVAGQRIKNQPTVTRDGKAQTYNFGQITVQGGEAYLGYVADGWAVATRVDVLLPDPLLGSATVSYFQSDPIWEITFPSLTYQVNSFTKLVAETEFTYNAPQAVDTDGIYQLKTVPVEYALVTGPDRINHEWLTGVGRLMLQVAF